MVKNARIKLIHDEKKHLIDVSWDMVEGKEIFTHKEKLKEFEYNYDNNITLLFRLNSKNDIRYIVFIDKTDSPGLKNFPIVPLST